MNDRFKFRTWYMPEYDKQRMIYGAEKTYDFMYGEPEIICADCFGSLLDSKEYIVMQCTGLKDKNGKLVYEGDIVRITKKRWYEETYQLYYLVCWDRTQWQLGLFKDQRPKSQENRRSDRKIAFRNIVSFEYYTPIKYFADCEVIGNIYENKSLLESEEQ